MPGRSGWAGINPLRAGLRSAPLRSAGWASLETKLVKWQPFLQVGAP